MEYGIRLLENAMPVSYLHPATEGALLRERKLFWVSECGDFGEPFCSCFSGEGEWAPKDILRALRLGVVGREEEWWLVRCGGCWAQTRC